MLAEIYTHCVLSLFAYSRLPFSDEEGIDLVVLFYQGKKEETTITGLTRRRNPSAFLHGILIYIDSYTLDTFIDYLIRRGRQVCVGLLVVEE